MLLIGTVTAVKNTMFGGFQQVRIEAAMAIQKYAEVVSADTNDTAAAPTSTVARIASEIMACTNLPAIRADRLR